MFPTEERNPQLPPPHAQFPLIKSAVHYIHIFPIKCLYSSKYVTFKFFMYSYFVANFSEF
jgi:hypothetical protein